MAIERISQDQETGRDGSADDRRTHRRSFLRLIGAASVGAVAAVSGIGRRDDGSPAQASNHEHPLLMGEININPPDRRTAFVSHPKGDHADYPALDVIRGETDLSDIPEDLTYPALRGILVGESPDSAAVVGRSIASGTGVLGAGNFGVTGHGEGPSSRGVMGTAPQVGVQGNGRIGVVGETHGTGGVGLLGVGSSSLPPDHAIDPPEVIGGTGFHYPHARGTNETLETDPFASTLGIGARAVGLVGVEGISTNVFGVGVLGSNLGEGANGVGVVGHAMGTGAVGVRGVGTRAGLHGISVDELGNVTGEGVVGEGATGVVGKSSGSSGVGVQGESDTGVGVHGESDDGVGVRGNSRNADGVRGRSEHADGHGVRGEGKTGVHGRASQAQGRGVVGEVEDDDEDGIAIEGRGKKGEGVRGEGKTGVRGKSEDANGQGVRGENEHGEGMRGEGKTGVRGRSADANGKGVHGENAQGDAVVGEGKTGVRGKSAQQDGVGVVGENDNGVGVEGRGHVGIRGVAAGHGGGIPNALSARRSLASASLVNTALPEESIAIQGIAEAAGSIGIHALAETSNSTALKVETTTTDSVALHVTAPEGGTAIHIRGAACFDTVGAGQFAANARSVTVNDPRTTEQSFVYAMITGDPRVGNGVDMVAIQWIERHPGSGFTVHLNSAVKRATPFSYFIVEPCPDDQDGEHHSV